MRICFSKFEWHCRKRDFNLLVHQVSSAGVHSMLKNVCLILWFSKFVRRQLPGKM